VAQPARPGVATDGVVDGCAHGSCGASGAFVVHAPGVAGGVQCRPPSGSAPVLSEQADGMGATIEQPYSEERLTVVIDKTDDGWYAARIPEGPGAHGQGRTPEQAKANVLQAMHDLTHEPTTAERVAFTIQARVVEPVRHVLAALRIGRSPQQP
jgi:hypothetical protein